MPYHFPSQDIKQNRLLGSYLNSFDGVTNFKIYFCSSSKAMADREKKRGRQKYKINLNILRTKRDF